MEKNDNELESGSEAYPYQGNPQSQDQGITIGGVTSSRRMRSLSAVAEPKWGDEHIYVVVQQVL